MNVICIGRNWMAKRSSGPSPFLSLLMPSSIYQKPKRVVGWPIKAKLCGFELNKINVSLQFILMEWSGMGMGILRFTTAISKASFTLFLRMQMSFELENPHVWYTCLSSHVMRHNCQKSHTHKKWFHWWMMCLKLGCCSFKEMAVSEELSCLF